MFMRFQGFFGIIVFLVVAWIFSEKKKNVKPAVVFTGVMVQLAVAAILLYVPVFKKLFLLLNNLVLSLEAATRAGTSFVFGYIGGGVPPFLLQDPGANFILAFQALPLVLVIGALSGLLFYWRILPVVVRGFSFLLQKTLNIGGALGLGASTTIFLGMVEAPLVIKPYLKAMTRSEIFSLMTVGMACIAGTVMILYATFLNNVIPDPLGHILIASFIHVAAAITIARIMVPETGPETSGSLAPERTATSSMDAVVRGTMDGLHLLLNIIAMLVVMVALVHLANQLIGLLPDLAGRPLTLQRILGFVMAPVVVALRHPLVRGPDRRPAHGDQDGSERAAGFPGSGQASRRRSCRPQPFDHGLRPVELRQLRKSRHPDRGTRQSGAGATHRDRGTRHEGPRGRHPRHLHDRRGDRDLCVKHSVSSFEFHVSSLSFKLHGALRFICIERSV